MNAQDPRLERCRQIGRQLAEVQTLSAERRDLLEQLRAEGWTMTALAGELGISRQWLYKLLASAGEAPET